MRSDLVLGVTGDRHHRLLLADEPRPHHERHVLRVRAEVGRDVAPTGLERSLAFGERLLADGVEDDVVGLAVRREVLDGVVDDLVGAERSHDLDVGGVAHRGDVGADVLGQLDGGRTDRPGCPVDEDALPARSFAQFRQVMARIAPSHTAAASANEVPLGFSAIGARSRTHTYSAWAPKRSAFTPKTSSPTANSVTADPTPATTPANSLPRIVRFGRRSPAKSRTNHGHGARNPQSVRFTVVACTSTSTSSSAGTGQSTSTTWRTSGPPYSVFTTARIVRSACAVTTAAPWSTWRRARRDRRRRVGSAALRSAAARAGADRGAGHG